MAESGPLFEYLTSQNGIQRTGFGELSANSLLPKIGWNFQYTVNSDFIKSTNANGGTITQADSQAILQTTTNSSGAAEISTIRSLPYINGIGAVIRFTSVFETPQDNSKQIIGYGDSNDGFFVGYNSTSFGFLQRKGGAETWIYTSEWNGSIPEGFNSTTGNVYQIKFQWLGYGEIRFFIEDRETGGFVLAHKIKYANANNTPSIYYPSLPLHAKINNSGNTSNMTLKTPSGMAGLECGSSPEVLTVFNGADNENLSVTTEYPILTIKNSSVFQGVNNRQDVKLNQISIAADGNKSAKFILYKNVDLSTSVSFVDSSSDVSPIQYDISSTSIANGRKYASYYTGKVESNIIDVGQYGYYLAPGEYFTVTAQSTLATIASVAMNVKTIF